MDKIIFELKVMIEMCHEIKELEDKHANKAYIDGWCLGVANDLNDIVNALRNKGREGLQTFKTWKDLKRVLKDLDKRKFLKKNKKYEQDFVEICNGIYACRTGETGYYYVHTNDGYEHGELSTADVIELLEELGYTDKPVYRKSWK